MSNRHSALATLLSLIVLAPSLASAAGPVLIHGNARGYPYEGGVDYPAGRYWSVVCEEKCVLKPAWLTIKRTKIETREGLWPGYVATVESPSRSLFLVKGLADLTEGELTTWYYNRKFYRAPMEAEEGNFRLKQEFAVDINGAVLSIKGVAAFTKDSSCRAEDKDCLSFPTVRWKYGFGDTERTLFTLTGNELGTPVGVKDFVVWVGDLDRDGQPDLLVRPQDRPDYLELALFLSSTLAPGKPWRPSSVFYWWDPLNPGC